MDTLRIPEDQPIENALVSKSIEAAQKKVEMHNFDIRKHLVEYDDVMNKQRESIYRRRRRILENADLRVELQNLIAEEIEAIVDFHTQGAASEWNTEEIIEQVVSIVGDSEKQNYAGKIRSAKTVEDIKAFALDWAVRVYEKREKDFGAEIMRTLERLVYLRTIDHLWVQHLDALDHLREGIGLRGYGQRDPLVEYKAEAFRLWNNLQASIRSEVARLIYKVAIAVQPQKPQEEKIKKDERKEYREELKKAKYQGAPETQAEEPTLAQKHQHQDKDGSEALREATISSSGSVRVISRLERERQQLRSPMPGLPASRENKMMSYSSPSSSSVPAPAKKEKVGRNDPCPCGSGKKYKKCHGR